VFTYFYVRLDEKKEGNKKRKSPLRRDNGRTPSQESKQLGEKIRGRKKAILKGL